MQSVTHAGGIEYGLPGGGIDDGETEEVGVVREVIEETGYTNFKEIRRIGTVEANYYNRIRKIYRQALATCYALRLANEDKQEQQLTDLEKRVRIENFWVTKEEALELISGPQSNSGEDLPLFKRYLEGKTGPYVGGGILVNSSGFDGMNSDDAKEKITEKFGTKKTTYKIRDWVFSRQRYWGEPIPMIHCPDCGVVPVPEKDLPVKLPEVKKYEPTGTGESPLAAIDKWVNVKCPKCKGKAKRETNTMPQWAGSSWYWLRYMDPKNKKVLVDKKKEKYWGPVGLYVGGAEHATRHLIYGRFWHKFLQDTGVVSTPEPFTRLISVGLIQAEDGRKMSKRFGNVINPDEIIATYGADTLRVYEMFMGPFSDAIAWKTSSLIGARRFIERVWRLQEKVVTKTDESVERELHKTIKKVGEDIANFKFNTAISQMMIFVNSAEAKGVTKKQYQSFVALLAPFAPHVAEELWYQLGNKKSVHLGPWPKCDSTKLVADETIFVVQVNGKVRSQITLPANSEEVVVRAAGETTVAKWLEGKRIRKVIFVANRLVNFVID
jgi:leucyl-tRNA synthetase